MPSSRSCRSEWEMELTKAYVKIAQSKNYKVVLVGVGPLLDLETLNVLNTFIVRADVLDDTVAVQVALLIEFSQSKVSNKALRLAQNLL